MDFVWGMICIIIGAAIGVFVSTLMAANSDDRPENRNTNDSHTNERK